MHAFLRNTPFDHATCPIMAFVILQATDVTFWFIEVFSGKSGQRRFARHTKARRIAESRTRLKRCASRFGLKFVAIGF